MTLYDLIKNTGSDYDTYDDVYDECITVSINLEPNDDYDEFCIALTKLIVVVDPEYYGHVICEWSNFIIKNMEVFREFSYKYWYKNYCEDEEDFVWEWMKELNLLLAGYGEDGKYGLYKQELIDKCY